MPTKETIELLKGATGHSEENLAKLHSGLAKMRNNAPSMASHQIVCDVIRSEHCNAQVKEGDKLVFDPFLNPEKSTGVMCPRALLPVMIQINSLWEMMAEWAESGKEELPEIVFRNIRCLDPGFEDGGVGGVIYQIHFEKNQ